jgi:hypothetical protein
VLAGDPQARSAPLTPSEIEMNVPCCAGFWMPAKTKEPRAQLAGVQKAPKHEVAGNLAPAKQRAL